MSATPVTIGLSAVAIAPVSGEMGVLTVRPQPDGPAGLPAGPFDADAHRTFELALRDFVTAQTGLAMGYVEQLYTFGDAGRDLPQAARSDAEAASRIVSVGYLALAAAASDVAAEGAAWRPWRDYFPYEDWRGGRPAVIAAEIEPALRAWAGTDAARRSRAERLFALRDPSAWRDVPVLERFELLYEAGLVIEAARDRGQPPTVGADALGQPMRSDHRRILATGLGRLRGKLRYRPVVFDLLPETFTLSALQKAVEAVTGQPLHKQNFRRGVERAGLVEGTGRLETATGGRPAELYRRRREVDAETGAMGLSLPVSR